jgi:hypothetical protein
MESSRHAFQAKLAGSGILPARCRVLSMFPHRRRACTISGIQKNADTFGVQAESNVEHTGSPTAAAKGNREFKIIFLIKIL